MAGTLSQLKIVIRCTGAVLRHPTTLLYPLLLPTVAIAAFGAGILLAFSVGTDLALGIPNTPVTWAVVGAYALFMAFVGLPVTIVFLNVAYCHEIHELYRGNRPLPGSGLAVALGKFPTILFGTLVIAAGNSAGIAAGGTGGSVGETAGKGLRAGAHVAATFMYPAIAVQEGGAREIASSITAAVEERWGSALVTSVGVGRVSGLVAMLGLFSAIGLVAGGVVGRLPFEPGFAFLPVEAGLPQVFVLAALALFGGLFLAFMLNILVTGPIATALYLYATEEEVPDLLALDVDEMTTAE